jgi:hypothetical protein
MVVRNQRLITGKVNMRRNTSDSRGHCLVLVVMTTLNTSVNDHRVTGTQWTLKVKRRVTWNRVNVFSAPDTLHREAIRCGYFSQRGLLSLQYHTAPDD